MSFRGRGRGRGGFGGRGFRPAKQVSFELFPEIEGLGHAEYSIAKIQLIKWSSSLQNYWNSSPYFYEDKSGCSLGIQIPDIERYSDKSSTVIKKPPLWHFIKLDADHVPAELVRGEKKGKHAVKRIRWNPALDSQNQDPFDKLFKKHEVEDQEGNEKKENEDEDEEDEEGIDEDDGEFSDEGDYGQTEYFDDDEDDFNMAEDDNDDAIY